MTRIRVRRKGSRPKDSGYMLLFLMLAVAVLTITMLGVARNYRRGIQRDNEVEMIHRGTEYARAVRKYFHKYGRYPTTIEQLESTNDLRFLRKRYKDPMSLDGEWKLAHITDIALKSTGGVNPAGGTSNGSVAATATDPSTTNANGPGQNSGDTTTTGTSNPTPVAGVGGTGASGTASGQVFGGGALLGVVSKSKAQGIHSFGDKSKYSEWFFIYDPSQDTGKSLLSGPYNPNMFVGGTNSGLGKGSGTGASGSSNSNSGSANPPSMNTPGTTAPPTTTP
jgi:type II secretory pathway pseudopilin PulG